MSGIVLTVVVAIPCITGIVMLSMVLRFCWKLVEKNNGDTKVLRDVAVLLRTFRPGPGGILAALTKIAKRT